MGQIWMEDFKTQQAALGGDAGAVCEYGRVFLRPPQPPA